MFEGFPALAAMNNARELVRPTPAGAGTAASPSSSARSRSRKSGPAWTAITSPATRSSRSGRRLRPRRGPQGDRVPLRRAAGRRGDAGPPRARRAEATSYPSARRRPRPRIRTASPRPAWRTSRPGRTARFMPRSWCWCRGSGPARRGSAAPGRPARRSTSPRSMTGPSSRSRPRSSAAKPPPRPLSGSRSSWPRRSSRSSVPTSGRP